MKNNIMKDLLCVSLPFMLFMAALVGCSGRQAEKSAPEVSENKFVTIQGENLLEPDGSVLFIQGTNLGN